MSWAERSGDLVQGVVELQLGLDDPVGVRAARRTAAEVVRGWAVRRSVGDDAGLVVSELVTNAFTHGRSDVVLRLLHDGDCVRIEVSDDDTRLPVQLAPDPQSLSGRGLALVAALSTLWGAERTASGKTVWAEFDVSDRRAH